MKYFLHSCHDYICCATVQCSAMLVHRIRHVAKSNNLEGAASNAARHRRPAAPSDLPQSGGAPAPPASPLPTCLRMIENPKNFDANMQS